MPTTRIADLIAIASRLSGVSVAQIKGKQRFRSVTRVRQAVAYVAVQQAKHSTPQIGKALGGRDHSTIIHCNKVVPIFTARDPDYAAFVARLQREADMAEPFLEGWGEQFEFALPVKPKAVKQRRPMFTEKPEAGDKMLVHNAMIAKGSAALLAALQAA